MLRSSFVQFCKMQSRFVAGIKSVASVSKIRNDGQVFPLRFNSFKQTNKQKNKNKKKQNSRLLLYQADYAKYNIFKYYEKWMRNDIICEQKHEKHIQMHTFITTVLTTNV